MKILVVEDDFTSRFLLQKILSPFGEVNVAVNGLEALQAFSQAINLGLKYDLITLDVMMPEMDGQETLIKIRAIEEQHGIFSSDGVKIIMTTALSDIRNVSKAYQGLCDGYLVKPIEKSRLFDLLNKLNIKY